jgi:hypothetical protein
LTHDGRKDEKDDERLGKQLIEDGHLSPFEHIAYALERPVWSGNFRGWVQYRKQLEEYGN